ncbi:TadE/TadG family type IV pilus assembly protein [Cryptosporangium japonicum]|uniref:TadE/TadG family type IV pilus assembly protein n=1 Tax=Cryptosporangium japonicum TaxID=80872 RepID=UPI0031D93E39
MGALARVHPVAPATSVVRGDRGSAVVEFALVSVVLLLLLLGVLQVAVYLYVRNIAAACAAEGARFAANADVDVGQGAERAEEILRRGAGTSVAERVTCIGRDELGEGGLRLVAVECAGALPVFFAPVGDTLPLRVTAHAVEESRPQ